VSTAFDRALVIAGTDLRLTLGDRRARFFFFVLPLMIVFVVGLAVHGATRLSLGLIDQSPGPRAHELRSLLARSRAVRVHTYSDPGSLQRAVRLGLEAGGVVIPSDYDDRLGSGQQATVQLLVDPSRRQSITLGATVTALVSRESALVDQSQLGPGVALTPAARRRTSEPRGFDYTAPSNLVLFTFITSTAAAAGMVGTRREGITRRMLSAPLRITTILLGMAMGRFAIALVQGAVIVVAGVVLFRIDWGDPLAVAALLVAFALVSTGAALLVASVARTPEQTLAVTPPLGIAFGMLGGCMWPLSIVGAPMRVFGHVFPHAWAMDAFVAIIGHHAGVGAIARQLLVLAAFAAALLALATARLRQVLLSGAAA